MNGNGSGVVVPLPAKPSNGVLVKVVMSVSLLIGSTAGAAVISHESRLAVIEERSKSIREDVQEIKEDVKKLLEGCVGARR